jgi:molecular chaperone DnaK
MADIFLSYAREDQILARLLAQALEAPGWSVWWDRRIPHGRDFGVYIQEQLDSASCIIVLWSKASVASQFVRDEAHEGLATQRLVPVVIDGVKPPLGFRQLQAANLSDWRHGEPHDEFERLLRSIADIVVPRANTVAEPPRPSMRARAQREPVADGRPRTPGAPTHRVESPDSASIIIGIDFGTTNSSVAVVEGGQAVILPSHEGSRHTPSVVALTGQGEWLVGMVARRQAVTNPANTVLSVKRLMGRRFADVPPSTREAPYAIAAASNGDVRVRVGDEERSPSELAAMILQKLKQAAEDYVGRPVTKAVISVPATFSEAQRKATRDAGAIAGLEVVRIVHEPMAAALAYGLDRRQNETVALCDFGGGGCDISLIDVDEGVVEVRATRGDSQLGGDDIDQRVTHWIVAEYKKTQGVDLSQDPMALQRLREAAERAKIELSTMTETTINLPFITAIHKRPQHLMTTLTRAKLDELADDLFQRMLALATQVFADAEHDPTSVDQVLLIGGSTRIPRVRQLLTTFFKRLPLQDINVDEIVAKGTAIQAGVLAGSIKDVLSLDVTPLSLGLETLGGVMTTLIPRNTTIPTRKSEVFSTAADNQTSVEIHLIQGERPLARDNATLGRFQLVGIPPAPRGVPQIEVSFTIDANGMVSVSAKDLGTGKEQGVRVLSGGLSPDEIDRMRAEAESRADEDRSRREQIDARNRADQAVYSSEKMVREAPKLLAADKAALERAIADVRQAIASGDVLLMNQAMERLNHVQHKAARSLYT